MSLNAERVAYLSALKMSNRPCHFREPDGSPCEPENHPDMPFHDGRPHLAAIPSRSAFGKTRAPTSEESRGSSGPDVQHALCQTLAAACRYRDSRACQEILSQWARFYPLQWRTDRDSFPYHSSPFVSRATCYEGLLAVQMHENLADRELAARVVAHWQKRVEQIIVPAYRNAEGDIWTTFDSDPRLGPGVRWIPWQQSAGAWGLDYGCEHALGLPLDSEPRQVALRAAKAVLRDAYFREGYVAVDVTGVRPGSALHDIAISDEPNDLMSNGWGAMRVAGNNAAMTQLVQAHAGNAVDAGKAFELAEFGRWVSRDVVALDGAVVPAGAYDYFGCPLAVATVLRHEPEHAQAKEVWAQLHREAVTWAHYRWLVPNPKVMPKVPQ